MNLTTEDPAVKKTFIISLIVEMAVAVCLLALQYDQLHHEDFDASVNNEIRFSKIKLKLARLRNQIFGPPPPTEEQIQHMAKQAFIEANRIVRQADQ